MQIFEKQQDLFCAETVESHSKNTLIEAETSAVEAKKLLGRELEIEYSFNPEMRNKVEQKSVEHGFVRKRGTVEDIASDDLEGYTVMVGNLTEGVHYRRSEANFLNSQILMIDVDNAVINPQTGLKEYAPNLTIEQALSHPLISKYGSLIYTSCSNTSEWNRFRVVFILDGIIDSPKLYKRLVAAVLRGFHNIADTACSDCVRFFYGNDNADIIFLDGEPLPLDEFPGYESDAIESFSGQGEGLQQVSEESIENVKLSVQLCTDVTIPVDNKERGLWRLRHIDPKPMDWQEWNGNLYALKNCGVTVDAARAWSMQSPKHNETEFYHQWKSHVVHSGIQRVRVSNAYLSKYFHQITDKAKNALPVDEAERVKFKEERRKKWIESRAFTPDVYTHHQFVDYPTILGMMKGKKIIALKSNLGSGKTQFLRTMAINTDWSFIGLTPRSVLGLQTAEKLSIKADEDKGMSAKSCYHLGGDDSKDMVMVLADRESRVIMCPESLHKLYGDGLTRDLLIEDEANSVIQGSLFSPHMTKNGFDRQDRLDKLVELIKNAQHVLLIDGNITDENVSYIARLKGCDPSEVLKIENVFQSSPIKINLLTATDGIARLVTKNSPLIKRIVDDVRDALVNPPTEKKAIVVISDSQTKCESLDEMLTEVGAKVLRIDGKTSQFKEIKDGMRVINEFIKEADIDVLIMSPSAEMGVDINLEQTFRHGYALFCGVISTDSQMQFLRRVRHCLEWTVWVAKFYNQTYGKEGVHALSELLREIERDSEKYLNPENGLESIISHASNVFKQAASCPHIKRRCEIAYNLTYERQNTLECFKHACKEKGYVIVEHDEEIDDETELVVKTTEDEIKKRRAESIFNAEDISEANYKELKKTTTLSQQQYDQVRKYSLKTQLPGIEDTTLWDAELIEKIECRKTIRLQALRIYATLLTPGALEVLGQKFYREKFSYIKDRSKASGKGINHPESKLLIYKNAFVLDLDTEVPFMTAFRDRGFMGLIAKPDVELFDGCDDLKKIIKSVKLSNCHKSAGIKAPKKQQPSIVWLSEILAKVGVKIKKKYQRADGKKVYEIVLPESSPETFTLLECCKRRVVERLFEYKATKLVTVEPRVQITDTPKTDYKFVIEFHQNTDNHVITELKTVMLEAHEKESLAEYLSESEVVEELATANNESMESIETIGLYQHPLKVAS